jgi:hypothetical protein
LAGRLRDQGTIAGHCDGKITKSQLLFQVGYRALTSLTQSKPVAVVGSSGYPEIDSRTFASIAQMYPSGTDDEEALKSNIESDARVGFRSPDW